jgi:restriction system protein
MNRTVAELRRMIAAEMTETIPEVRATGWPGFRRGGRVGDEEMLVFVASNPYLDEETRAALLDGLAFDDDLMLRRDAFELPEDLRPLIRSWALDEEWRTAGHFRTPENGPPRTETRLWPAPLSAQTERWPYAPLIDFAGAESLGPELIIRGLKRTSSGLLVANQLLDGGRLLTEMPWRDFEKLVAELLERDGWAVTLTRGTRDGGLDVIAQRQDHTVGLVRTIWQAKKYGADHAVGLHQVRDLSGVLDRDRATKAMIVTTSRLTRGAIEWIRQDKFRLGYMGHEQLKDWVRGPDK